VVVEIVLIAIMENGSSTGEAKMNVGKTLDVVNTTNQPQKFPGLMFQIQIR
jgi:hypothetical protein